MSTHSMRYSRAALALVIVAAAASPAHADEEDSSHPDLSYLSDGGALPFVWGALGLRVLLNRHVEPRQTPLMFSGEDGGAPSPSWELPAWTITAGAGLVASGMLLHGDAARWYHVKGLAETLSTNALVTGALKVGFGRHRPGWDPTTNLPDDRRSFPSGHSTEAFAVATYASMYLRRHVFDAHRDGDEWPAYEIATYAGLYAAASAVGFERVAHDKHHGTDVLAGAALGTASSWLFFRYQERRYRNRHERETEPRITPIIGEHTTGLQLGLSW